MQIIGCDLHTRQQTMAMLYTKTESWWRAGGEDLGARSEQRAELRFHAIRAGARGDRSDRIDAVVQKQVPVGKWGQMLVSIKTS
jgi:hypothetical protein